MIGGGSGGCERWWSGVLESGEQGVEKTKNKKVSGTMTKQSGEGEMLRHNSRPQLSKDGAERVQPEPRKEPKNPGTEPSVP